MRKVGVIGPEDSVTRILAVNQHVTPSLQLIPLIYEDIEQAPHLLKENASHIDAWLFSGPAPYLKAIQQIKDPDNVVYCSFSGDGLYRCFLQIANTQQLVLNEISIDIPETENLQEAIGDLAIPLRGSHIHSFGADCNAESLVAFHLALWKSGKTKAAISSLGAVYKALTALGIPVYRNTGTTASIRKALQVLSEKLTTAYFKSTQVGFQIIEISNYDQLIEKMNSPYELQLVELQIKKDLLGHAEKLSAYLLEKGHGVYELFSSRGTIELELPALHSVIRKITSDIGSRLHVGIGFGNTVASAHSNASRAILHAKRGSAEKIIIIQEDGVIVEAADASGELSYPDHSDDPLLLNQLHNAKVSVKTYKRIAATADHRGWTCFTSSQLAEELSSSERNIRRILTSLCAVHLLESAGEGYTATRGRPSRLYRFSPQTLPPSGK